MKTMTVHDKQTPIYDIVFSKDYSDLACAVKPLNIERRKICIVSETNVAPHYLEEVASVFKTMSKAVTTFVFDAGEENKNLKVVERLYEHLIISGFDRKDMLVALGGGVTGDLTGYAAATYLRGISFIQMPTSLLSQVDSSIGGKTGVDFNAYKNMVGAFHQPSLVYINLGTLMTLTDAEYLSGMGEIIKHGLIKDIGYYQWMKRHRDEIMARDLSVLETLIYQSVDIKRMVVENDPKEQGERALLNFGHTIGHAVEKLMNFTMLHGECVSVGMAAAARLSAERGYISKEMCKDIFDTIRAFNLPVSARGLSCGDVLAATKHDKKMDAGRIKFVVLKPEGHAQIDMTITDEELRSTIDCMIDAANDMNGMADSSKEVRE